MQIRKLGRIAIVGSTGTGKMTLARGLASRLGLRLVEFDALHWESNWVEAPHDLFLTRVDEALREDGWVADGKRLMPPLSGGAGVSVMNSIKGHGVRDYKINLMVMDYGSATPSNCVIGTNGSCDIRLRLDSARGRKQR